MAEQETLQINLDIVNLEGNLEIPTGAKGIVMFAHGSGSSRWVPSGPQQKSLACYLFYQVLFYFDCPEN